MSLDATPSSERVHIGIFGKRNAGKSSLLNAMTGQDHAVVSDVKGTTTDPVKKSMELLPIGPVLITDTPGIDDDTELGALRTDKTRQVLRQTDAALLVVDATIGLESDDEKLIRLFKDYGIGYLVVFNKSDLLELIPPEGENEIYVSCESMARIGELRERISKIAVFDEEKLRIVGDLLNPGDFVVLATPIDKAAPKGRLILPQQQAIRDVLEADAAAIVVKEFELREVLENLRKKPALVITDSQVFAKVSADTPEDVPLTSFSILMARYKGVLDQAVEGVKALDGLEVEDEVLICEGCTHHRQCDDIGTVKLPRWIRRHCGTQARFSFASGGDFPDDVSRFKLILHCGGCMLNAREMRHRLRQAVLQGVPLTNYGVAIAHMQGILKRSLSIFPHLYNE
ncbi:MAG: [FeFe] hydrogenase H-cluster maturation GTPase HydF [Clostridiales bacterium]|jgi:[FeFe] hydrogenase H-cluster maturation GTPase HydF|nr:[FeFe] hydrogenase H-cluster maturation GTPase HydF [Clostridiales bacterium]